MAKHNKETCLADLEARILSLDLAPGTALDETSLASEYGISRTPLREVLQRLKGAGYVTAEDHRTAKVASMDLAQMRMFFQTAPMLYAAVGRLAAEYRTPAQLDMLKAAQLDFSRATRAGDAGAAALANHRFHGIIGEMSYNAYLLPALERLRIDHTRLSQTFYRPASPEEETAVETARAHHEAMIEAIEAGAAAQMVDLTLAHWDLSRDRVERFVRPDPLPLMEGFADAV